jgi:glycosyltransferase involved in cell wall biosynthesis
MSAKLPVVASNTGGLPEIVQDGLSGILVPVGDSHQIGAALEQLLADADLRRKMGEVGYQSTLNKHRIDDIARKYVDIFLGKHARTESTTRTGSRDQLPFLTRSALGD